MKKEHDYILDYRLDISNENSTQNLELENKSTKYGHEGKNGDLDMNKHCPLFGYSLGPWGKKPPVVSPRKKKKKEKILI